MTNLPKSRQSDLVVQKLGTEVLIYDLKINKAYSLNETSALVWQLSDGKNSIKQISQSLSQKLNQPITEDLVWLALDQLKKDGLLENNDQFETNFGGLNRRQIIKKVGLATMAAFPVIVSISAPKAAQAQSGLLANGAACSMSTQCAGGQCIASACCSSSNPGDACNVRADCCGTAASRNCQNSTCCISNGFGCGTSDQCCSGFCNAVHAYS